MKNSVHSFFKSIRARLLIGSLVWLLVSILATAWVLTDLFNDYSKRQLASELNIQMNQLLDSFSLDEQRKVKLDFVLNDPRFEQPLSGLYWQIDSINNNKPEHIAVLRSRSLWDQSLSLPEEVNSQNDLLEISGPKNTELFAQIKQISPAEGDNDYRLIIAIDQDVLYLVVNKFNLIVTLLLGILAITIAIALLIQIWLSLKPIAQLRHKLENVLNGSNKQINGDYPSEVQPLVNAFNEVLKANEDMVEQARSQAGNLAHALKTPLSIISNSIAQDNTEQGKLIKEQIKSAQHHIGHHLSKARATAIGVRQNKQTIVKPVVDSLVRTIQRLYQDKNIQFNCSEIPENWVFIGDSNDLQEMLGNLIDNAYKWANKNIWLNISYLVDKNRAQLSFIIEDDGHGLSVEQQNLLFKRGIRLDEQTPGTGLGLAIVSDLALAYGGNVYTNSSKYGGLRISLQLPAKLLTNTQK